MQQRHTLKKPGGQRALVLASLRARPADHKPARTESGDLYLRRWRQIRR